MKQKQLLAGFLSLVISLTSFCQIAFGQHDAPSKTDDARLARLAGLAKVWGTVKFFHPLLAYREIDWDKALVDTIPRVNNAATPQEYAAALNQMLAVLNDKSTRAEIESKTETTADGPTPTAKLIRNENGILVIEVGKIATAIATDYSSLNAFLTDINQAIPNAIGIVIDARSHSKLHELALYHFDNLMRQVLPAMLDGTVVLGATRYRMHNGYATQTTGGATDYYSALVSAAPKTIVGRSATKTPLAFIVNENSPAFSDVVSGMQSAGRALVIQEGEQTTSETFKMSLPQDVSVHIRTLEVVNADGSVELQPDVTITKTSPGDAALEAAIKAVRENRTSQRPHPKAVASMQPTSEKDSPYEEMTFPNTEYRLLALFRFWNVIDRFFPYKHLIGESWQTVLPRFIHKFEANKDAAGYQLTLRELVAEIRDTHGFLRNTNQANERLGMFVPPVFTGYLENKSVVTKVLDDKLPIKVGDVVLALDGEPVEKRREDFARYVAASTPQSLMKVVNARLLLGPKDSVVKLKVQSTGGVVREVQLPRTLSISDPKLGGLMRRTTPLIQVLPSGYGYVDLARLQVGDVDQMFAAIKDTPAVIFDLRGYPNGTIWSIAPRLTEKKNLVAALFSRPILEGRSLSDSDLAEPPSYSFSQRLPDRDGDIYRGKVVVLINEDAISQSEHSCLFLQAATEVTYIGTPTAGANGDITWMVLPGKIQASFSGHNVRHADGRQLQRIGIQPTIRVAPTIRGLVEGRDEILDAAIKFLQNPAKK